MLLGRAFASSGGPTRTLSIMARFPRARGRERSETSSDVSWLLANPLRAYSVALATENELDHAEPGFAEERNESTQRLSEAHSNVSTRNDRFSSQQEPRALEHVQGGEGSLSGKAFKHIEDAESKPGPAALQADAFFAGLTTKGKPKERTHKSLLMTQHKLERRRLREAQRALSPAQRSLRYRSVLAEDIRDAERRFSQFTKGLDEEILAWDSRVDKLQEEAKGPAAIDDWTRKNPHPRVVHADTLRAHLNHLLYLSARAGFTSDYNMFSDLFERYDLELDSRTHLTRLIMLDRKPQVSLARMTRIWKDWKRSSDLVVSPTIGKLSEAARAADETVLANQTIWMLAKRGHWRIVGPIYSEMLRNTPSSSSTSSNAFPSEYFTPSNLLSGIYPTFDQSRADKVTYQSLIRALGFHGNVVAALNVMGDMLRDDRGYTVDVSDYVAVMQGFAKFGNSLEPEEAHRRQARRLSFHTETDMSGDLLEVFPPLIFPDPLPLVQPSERGSPSSETIPSMGSRKDGKPGSLKKLTEIWGNKVDGWVDDSTGTPALRERTPGMDIAILTKVFRAMLGTKPSVHDTRGAVPSRSSRYYATSRRTSLSPSPKATFIVLMAFARCSDGDPEVLKSVWADLEDKFGTANEEGWVGWLVDKRLQRIVHEISKV